VKLKSKKEWGISEQADIVKLLSVKQADLAKIAGGGKES